MAALTVGDIIDALAPRRETPGVRALPAHGVSFSSKACTGKIFVAVAGGKTDGHTFIDEAFSNGAVAAVIQDEKYLSQKPAILVGDSRAALSRLAAHFSGEPSKNLKMVGITGTNGKTTTNWITHHLFCLSGEPSMRLGTLGLEARLPGGEVLMYHKETLTTPDALTIQENLREASGKGIKACVMEVSSHALSQARADDIDFDTALFTNLTRDHLDYHPDMEHYYQSKRKLFELMSRSTKKRRTAILNFDSEYGLRLASELPKGECALIGMGRHQDSHAVLGELEQDLSGSAFKFAYEGGVHHVKSPYIGDHNAQNLLGALLAAHSTGFDMRKLTALAPSLPQVPGRLECVGNKEVGVYVDFAHTPDALAHAARTLRPITRGKLWIVFGCGGDRDRGKRPEMAKIAGELGDKVVVTSDNPRTENPLAIIKDILSGAAKRDVVEPDRRKAIELAVSGASSGDVVLVAGKGHEDYQIIGTTKYPFSDVEEVRRVLS